MDSRVQHLIARLTANPHSAHAVDELAQAVNLSASHLRSLFKAQTGVSLVHYRATLRMQAAKALLEAETFLNVKQVMTRVGVNDDSHFGRDFKKAYGLPPRRYRAHYFATHRSAA